MFLFVQTGNTHSEKYSLESFKKGRKTLRARKENIIIHTLNARLTLICSGQMIRGRGGGNHNTRGRNNRGKQIGNKERIESMTVLEKVDLLIKL